MGPSDPGTYPPAAFVPAVEELPWSDVGLHLLTHTWHESLRHAGTWIWHESKIQMERQLSGLVSCGCGCCNNEDNNEDNNCTTTITAASDYCPSTARISLDDFLKKT
ncbi:hypothetical protein Vafri_21304 [Volvox africanus]|uniref:Uncharacterized protein n=1 Tax=Volvox africanus TaxID=51714 RepID=A0A8J4BTW7_9CHLO|nr:hypothetical protein Vafri_21304 [Volvox africanus]